MAKYRSKEWREQISKKTTKLNVEVIQKLREAFLRDCTTEEACFYADVKKSTYYGWLKQYPELLDEFTDCRNRPVLKAREVITNALESGDRATAQWYLTKKIPDEFGERSKVEITGSINKEDLTPEESDPVSREKIKKAGQEYLEKVKQTLKETYKLKHKDDDNQI